MVTKLVESSVVEQAEQIVGKASRKQTPVDVAVKLVCSRWLLDEEKTYFQQEVGYAEVSTRSMDQTERSAGFERARELINEMNVLIKPRWEAARALRMKAEEIKSRRGCDIETAFRWAKFGEPRLVVNRSLFYRDESFDEGYRAPSVETKAKKLSQLRKKQNRSRQACNKSGVGR